MKKKDVKQRKAWFRAYKKLMHGRYKKTNFIYIGEEFKDGSFIVSNHEGTDAPMALEIWLNKRITMLGASEMNSGFKAMYKYQTRIYYHEKKGWNLHLARAFCLLATPLTNLFYKGLNLISTYRDARFFTTIKLCIEAIKDGSSLAIFPEDSKEGYKPQLDGLHKGFLLILETAFKKNMDIPVVISYFNIKTNTYIFDNPILYSELLQKYEKRENISNYILNRINEFGRMTFESTNNSSKEA